MIALENVQMMTVRLFSMISGCSGLFPSCGGTSSVSIISVSMVTLLAIRVKSGA